MKIKIPEDLSDTYKLLAFIDSLTQNQFEEIGFTCLGSTLKLLMGPSIQSVVYRTITLRVDVLEGIVNGVQLDLERYQDRFKFTDFRYV